MEKIKNYYYLVNVKNPTIPLADEPFAKQDEQIIGGNEQLSVKRKVSLRPKKSKQIKIQIF